MVEADVSPTAGSANFRLHLTPGLAMMQTWLTGEDGESRGAYFVSVRRLP
jgi:hypothetical protein